MTWELNSIIIIRFT